ncbi:MAG TPA: DNA circularization N-terminal domain-containing protein [Candidatus Binatia bacterium]|nr:DNA circularization N-terminal domain-containing protein [Candidatus Binatia bacterium]
MTWRDDLRRVTIGGRQLIGASFRGVPFFVDGSDRSGGRRIVVHEFPLRDDPFVEDLGRKARPFRVDGYVVGDDYLAEKNALLTALEDEAGPGELVHPFHGVRRAIAGSFSVRETKADGGMAMFAIEFTETPAQAPVPVEVVDATEQVSDASDAALLAIESELVEKYSTTGLPAFAIASAETALVNAAAALEDTLAPIVVGSQELAMLTSNVALLMARASSLVRQPAEVLDEFRAVIADLVDTIAAVPGAVADALVEAYATDLGPAVEPTTATRERELENQAALTGALRRVIATEAARFAARASYTSIEEAMAARDAIATQLEEQATTASDTAYPSLVSLRSELLRAVPGGTSYARVVTVTRKIATPSLLLAYQLYGSVDLEGDILARNAVEHPGFIAGEIKVLSDG